MDRLYVRLFRRFDVRHQQQAVPGFESRKVQELFAYLLLHNDRPHSRELLATMMWPTSTTRQARKQLRHTLWQLRSAVASASTADDPDVLWVDHDWLRIHPDADLWLDTQELEHAYLLVKGIPGAELDSQRAQAVQQALDLYRGDLLEGWYEEWCLFERERLQGLHLALLGKQMIHYEVHGDYERGLDCGHRALQCDVAHERIHRRMMRLRYRAGDRTGAVRQYQRCVAFLRDELEVEPAAQTVALYERIRAGRPLTPRRAPSGPSPKTSNQRLLSPPQALKRLEQLQIACSELQYQLQETMETFQAVLDQRD
jgi:DNA-binding SARP family transcriptional activator